VTDRGTRTLRLDADPETTAMVMHAAARGAVRLPDGSVAKLTVWPVHGTRARIETPPFGDTYTRTVRKSTVDPIVCGDCGITPADPDAATAGMRLCRDCGRAQQHLND
jgi:hypothetical protein